MTNITVYCKDNTYTGFCIEGHAGYADEGEDIVCAGISILVFNTMNAIEKYTDEDFSGEADKQNGDVHFRFDTPAGHDAALLMDAMILGLQEIESSYGKKFLKLQFREV